MFKIKKGLDLPIEGAPQQVVSETLTPNSVALIGFDYVGMKPTMLVAQGDRVKLGDPIFSDKKNPGVNYTSPGAGIVSLINRGEKRALQSVVIELDGEEEVSFHSYDAEELDHLTDDQVRTQLITSGLWTSFRTRPFSKVPEINSTPFAIFINGMDTNPLSVDPSLVINEALSDFLNGLKILSKLNSQYIYCCTSPDLKLDLDGIDVNHVNFSGPHPAGLSGTHIHKLAPASTSRVSWSINYQDVIAISRLFSTGKLCVDRIISVAGPAVTNPMIIKTRLGANINDLSATNVNNDNIRLISGSVFNGRKASGPYAFLGRYHLQVTALKEGSDREFMSYLRAGFNKHSITRTFISAFLKNRLFPFTTTTNGSDRAMVPIANFEKVMPLDILPTQLLRALIVGDSSVAQQLGCLELDEEDLALCTYSCPSKYDYGLILRNILEKIEKDG